MTKNIILQIEKSKPLHNPNLACAHIPWQFKDFCFKGILVWGGWIPHTIILTHLKKFLDIFGGTLTYMNLPSRNEKGDIVPNL